MSADGKTVLDAGKVIVEDKVRLPVLEGPKLSSATATTTSSRRMAVSAKGRRRCFAHETFMDPTTCAPCSRKGTTTVQAPHQGGYIETPSGEGWFLHFNSTGAYGRIVHLQPVRWQDDWPVMGELLPGAPNGQPVDSHAMPNVGGTFPPVFPQTSDEFDSRSLAVQWEWNHNPTDTHWSLSERPGYMRLKALPATNFVSARNTLTQVLQGRTSEITTRMFITAMNDGQRAGLAMLGKRPSWIGVTQRDGTQTHCVCLRR